VTVLRKSIGYLVAAVAGFAGGAAWSSGHWWPPSAWKPGTAVATATPPSPAAELLPDLAPVQLADIRVMLDLLPADQRAAIVNDAAAFKRFVDAESAFRSVIAGARANKLHENAQVLTLVRRRGEQVLAETYLNELVRSNLGADFPKPDQVQKFFEDNRDRFQVPPQVHLWQVFWPIAADASETQKVAIEVEAQSVLTDLRSGKLAFAEAAQRYSKHAASRLTGGYMGLINVNDLLPEVKSAVADLKEGALSDPIRTSAGFHVVKRGASVPARRLELAEVEPQVRELFVREAAARVRESVTAKARETYPRAAPESEFEAWRAQLAQTAPAAPAA
jgi:peptidylprolyl isomerase